MNGASEKTFAEFFAGIGLMRIGLESAGWQIAFANDIDEDKWEMYRDHFGDTGEFLLRDVHNVGADDVPEVALATASFPCNDLSLAGGRKGLAGAQSSAFWGFADVLGKMRRRRPRMVMLENVPGFLTSHKGEDFRNALLGLNRLGYAVDAFLVDAVRFVPQSRQRLFVVGSLAEYQPMVCETGHFFGSECRPKRLADFIFCNRDISWKLRDLPALPHSRATLEEVIEHLPPTSPMWWSRERCDYLLNQMSVSHLAFAMAMIRDSRISYGTVFRRVRHGKSMAELRTDGIAGCLRTPRGGSGRQILVMAGRGNFAARLLTPRECARLMGADKFTIRAPLNQALFGFGDAVCVPVIEWIARNYLNPMWEEQFAPASHLAVGEKRGAYRSHASKRKRRHESNKKTA
jgi:DNA (cytosine-5)-methyltransferase 1